ncbi:short chain dehydrogenase domain-containing protein [Sarocladium implicatum]|nr:short chain dehydrogenase domain-containing protein [Sarocladium implicatum]
MSWPNQKLTWLITGASSGFGLQLSLLALSHGHQVIATSRSPSSHPDLLSSMTSKGGRFLQLDINDPQSPKDFVDNLEKEGVEIDVLVNAAGYSILGPAEAFTEEEVRDQMETGFFGPYRLMREVVRGMRERRRGMVLSLSSGAGVDGRPSMGVYGASKAAMDGLMRVTAKELSPFGLRTLTVHLGGFDTNFAGRVATTSTPFQEDYQDSMVEKVIHSIGGGRFQPDGDHTKACEVIYEVVMGEGRGEGLEGQTVLPLGRDMWKTLDGVEEQQNKTRELFAHIGNNVYLEK